MCQQSAQGQDLRKSWHFCKLRLGRHCLKSKPLVIFINLLKKRRYSFYTVYTLYTIKYNLYLLPWGMFQGPQWMAEPAVVPAPHPSVLVFPVRTYLCRIESTCWLLLAHLYCRHHYARALGPLLRKMRVTWTQALSCHDSQSDNPDGY